MWLCNGLGGSISCVNNPNTPPKLEERLRGVTRLKQYRKRTEECSVPWYKAEAA